LSLRTHQYSKQAVDQHGLFNKDSIVAALWTTANSAPNTKSISLLDNTVHCSQHPMPRLLKWEMFCLYFWRRL